MNLAALAHTNLNTGVIDKTVFATGDVFLDESFVFPHLTTAFDFGLGEIFGQKRIKFAPILTDDPRRIAQKFIRPGRRKEKDFGTRQLILVTLIEFLN